MGRLIRLATLAAALLSAPPAALAHGGGTIASGSNAAYKLSIQALDIRLDDGRPAVDLTAYPIRRTNGAPELDAQVEFQLGERRFDGEREGDGIAAEIPLESAGAWRKEPLAVTLTGAAGMLTIRADASIKGGGVPGWLFPVSGVCVALLIALTIVRRRRINPTTIDVVGTD